VSVTPSTPELLAHRARQIKFADTKEVLSNLLKEAMIQDDFDNADAAIKRLASLFGPNRNFELVPRSAWEADVPPIEYLCEPLDLSPGRPPKLVGMGGAGKSWALQSMAMTVSLGLPLWDKFPTRSGPVVHLDYEMGQNQTMRRYRTLAAGLDVPWHEAHPLIDMASLPRVYLNSTGAYDALCRVCEGRVLCIIDSLRRTLPGEDENNSAITQYVDEVTRASTATGTTIVLAHHASTKGDKTAANKDSRGFGRGTSALLDASGSELQFMGDVGEPITVHHARGGEGGKRHSDFRLVLAPASSHLGAGLRVRYDGIADVQSASSKFDVLVARVKHVIRSKPNCGTVMLRAAVGGKASDVDKAVAHLVEIGEVVDHTRPHPNGSTVHNYTVDLRQKDE